MPDTDVSSLHDWLRSSIHPDEFTVRDFKTQGVHFEAVVPNNKIQDVAGRALAGGYFLESLTAVDFTECFEIVYHFNHWAGNARFVAKIVVDKTENRAPSLSGIYKSASWFEREVREMFGIAFEGLSSTRNLLLPDTTAYHPLLKSFKGQPKGADVEESLKLIGEDAADFKLQEKQSLVQQGQDYYLNLGPQHPSTHGVLRILLHLKGERILDAEPIIGYSHRHHEKMFEIQNYLACWPNFGRLDYVGAMSYNLGYALLVEKAMGVTPSPRVEAIRVLTTEFNRIASHLLWLGTFLMDLGAFTPFFYCFDDREGILDILEMVTGERLTYDYYRFGGVDRDIPAEFVPAAKAFIPHFKSRLRDYEKLISDNVIFRRRTQGLGALSREDALSYGVTGPMLRACGVPLDLRRTEPYSIYDKLDFEIPTENGGDVWARFRIRFREMHESLKIIQQLIDQIPAGEVKAGKLPKNVPKGEYYSAVESARGSFGIYLVSDGTLNPYRMKLRTPSFSNLNAIVDMAPGAFISDMVAILGSTDIVLPEIDR